MSVPMAILFVLGFGYLVAMIVMAVTQERRIFQPRSGLAATPDEAGLAYENVRLTSADGTSLHAWWLPPPTWADRPFTLLFLHGAATNLGDLVGNLAYWQGLGFAILAVDYRGYGESAGRPTEAGLYDDAKAAWDHLRRERRVEHDRIVVFGVSLGVAVAAELASRVQPQALILEGGFTRIADVAARRYWWLPVRQLIRIDLAAVDRLRSVRARKLFIHSLEDATISYAVGVRLFRAAASPKTLLRIRGLHARAYEAEPERVNRAVMEFLATLSPGDGPSVA